MASARSLAVFRSCLRRFRRDRDGVSAVEFALTLPLMLTLYLGAVEAGDGFAIQFKATLAARTVTDLASQYISINNAAMSSILGASTAVVAPYPTGSMAVTLSEITTDAHGNGKVIWSDTLGGTARTAGTNFTLPTNLQLPNITVLFGEVTYPYTPPLGYVMTGTINIYQSMYFYPRLSTTITRVNS